MPPKKKPAPKGPKTKAKPIVFPRTQRKIYHLLDHQGSGDDFRYLKKLSVKTGFEEGEEVFLTEKWDGTTVQATNQAIFKRIDRMRKGDPNKHSASEKQRYELVQLDLEAPQNKYIARAVADYVDTFKKLEDGLCIYFEALGNHIGSRFQHIPDFADIRVFDFSKNDKFLSFEETIALAEQLELPLTAYVQENLGLPSLIDRLETPRCYDDVDAALEGYVIRQAGFDLEDGGKIAKFREEDVYKILAS
jgi:hypothetical protein